jgi:hypothetical protein
VTGGGVRERERHIMNKKSTINILLINLHIRQIIGNKLKWVTILDHSTKVSFRAAQS